MTPTQTQYPLKAVLRTLVAYLLGILVTWLLRVMPGLGTIIDSYSPEIVDYLTLAIAGAAGGLFTWVMSRPAINHFLTKIGLGAAPKATLPDVATK